MDGHDTLSPEHRKIVTAAALTHNQTGLVIASHTGPDMPAFAQMEVLKANGVKPSSFVWVHAQYGTMEGNIKAAREGTWISFDNINTGRDLDPGSRFSTEWYAERIVSLKEEGLLNCILTSHDAGWYKPGQENGGDFRGFSGIFTSLVPSLKKHGFTQEEIDQLLIHNPREAFSIKQII